MQNFSLYNIRKTVRQAQNVLMDPEPELLAVRSATTTDSWGPSTEQLEDIMKQSYRVGIVRIVDVVFARISEYMDSHLSRGGSVSEKLYYSAVHYVNSGNEWRIVLKCLKVVEYLILWGGDSAIRALEEYSSVVSTIEREYQDKAKLDATESTTTAQIKQAEHFKAVYVQAELVLKLCNDASFRENQLKIASKMDDNRVGQGNGATLNKSDDNVPAYMVNFKQKKLDRSKIQNSNLKSEIRNYAGHTFHPRERRPGLYQVAGKEMIKPDSLLDDDEEEEDYDDDEEGDYDYEGEDAGYKDDGYFDSPYSDSKKPELESTDSFGGFQAHREVNQEPLLSFDEPETPTTQNSSRNEKEINDLLS